MIRNILFRSNRCNELGQELSLQYAKIDTKNTGQEDED